MRNVLAALALGMFFLTLGGCPGTTVAGTDVTDPDLAQDPNGHAIGDADPNTADPNEPVVADPNEGAGDPNDGDPNADGDDPNAPADPNLGDPNAADPNDPDAVDPNAVPGTLYTLEPDDYADESELDTVLPQVTLTVTGSDNADLALAVTATDDNLDLAPTGAHVFGHANVGFFNDDRRLRMDFASPARFVSLDFAGGTFFDTEIGRLEVYDADDQLLAAFVSGPRESGEVEVLSITRASADIAWAIAYVADGEGSFGRLDRLRFRLAD